MEGLEVSVLWKTVGSACKHEKKSEESSLHNSASHKLKFIVPRIHTYHKESCKHLSTIPTIDSKSLRPHPHPKTWTSWFFFLPTHLFLSPFYFYNDSCEWKTRTVRLSWEISQDRGLKTSTVPGKPRHLEPLSKWDDGIYLSYQVKGLKNKKVV